MVDDAVLHGLALCRLESKPMPADDDSVSGGVAPLQALAVIPPQCVADSFRRLLPRLGKAAGVVVNRCGCGGSSAMLSPTM